MIPIVAADGPLQQHPTTPRKTCRQIVEDVHKVVSKDPTKVTGVELDTDDFSHIRFGTDRRLDEAARMLCSSVIPSVRAIDRPELKCVFTTTLLPACPLTMS